MRRLAGLALLLCATGCGGTIGAETSTQAARAVEALLPAPAIEAVDQPAEPDALMLAHGGRSTDGESSSCFIFAADDAATTTTTPTTTEASYDVCQCEVAVATGSGTEAPKAETTTQAGCPRPTKEMLAQLRAQQREYEQALTPAADSSPRTIARLPFGPNGRLEVAAWRTQADRLCMEASSWDGQAGGSNGPFGSCVLDPSSDCTPSLCFQELTRSNRDGITGYGLVAVVAPDADRIDITLRGGENRSYPLTGPLVPGFPERVFMVDLGATSQRGIDVFAGEERVAHAEKSATMLAYESCVEQYDPLGGSRMPSQAELQAASDRFQECLRQHGAGG